jgi:hypothetical protein
MYNCYDYQFFFHHQAEEMKSLKLIIHGFKVYNNAKCSSPPWIKEIPNKYFASKIKFPI